MNYKLHQDLFVYKDRHNVQNKTVRKSVLQSMKNIKQNNKNINDELDDFMNYCSSDEQIKNFIHQVVLNVDVVDVFTDVWCVAKKSPSKLEIVKIIHEEIKESIDFCSFGLISRLISSLDGFTDKVRIFVDKRVQINNVLLRTNNDQNELILNYGYLQHEINE